MICEKCRANISDTAKFCPKCGTKVEIAKAQIVEQKLAEKHEEKQVDMVICPKCGTANPLTANFCKKDGTPLQKISPVHVDIKPPEAIAKEMKPEAIREPIMEIAPTEIRKIEPEKEKPVEEENRPAKLKEKEIKSETVVETKSVQISSSLKTEEKIEKAIPEKVVAVKKPEANVTARANAKPVTIIESETKPDLSSQPKNKETAPSKTVVVSETKSGSSKTWVWLIIIGLIVVFSGTGIYLYFSGQIVNKSEDVSVSQQVSEPAQPLQMPVEVAKSPELPQVPQQQIEPEIEEQIPQQSKSEVVKPPIPPVQITPVDFTKLEREINTSLRKRGLNDIYAEVNRDLIATLTGNVKSQNEKDIALSVVGSHREIKEVRDDIQIKVVKLAPPSPPKMDPAKLEDGINRALRNMGVNGVVAEVSDDLQVTLKGTVTSAADKDKAFEIAKTFKDVKRIRDIIFVVEQ
jgi:osmotically-inducible protein OsmY/ribosomal protein L40E